jgi:hypothetical protein
VDPNTGGVQAGLMNFRNGIINGDMRINQRGTSTDLNNMTAIPTASAGFVVDRWNTYRGWNGSSFDGNGVMAQGFITSSDLPFQDGISNFVRMGRIQGDTKTTYLFCTCNMESKESKMYAGKTITLSFYYRTGANIGGTFQSLIYGGIGTDQALRNGISANAQHSKNHSNSANWTKGYHTRAILSNTSQVCISFTYAPLGNANINDYFDLTGVQLEVGPVVTQFETRPFAVELQLCQRYFWRLQGGGYGPLAIASQITSNYKRFQINFPASMRSTPSFTLSGSITCDPTSAIFTSASTIELNSTNNINSCAFYTISSSGTAGHCYYIYINSTTGYIDFNAEL